MNFDAMRFARPCANASASDEYPPPASAGDIHSSGGSAEATKNTNADDGRYVYSTDRMTADRLWQHGNGQHGETFLLGVFDGHGKHGHLVSNAAMSIMLDYLRNKNDVFKSRKVHNCTQEQILSEIKKAFRYTQQALREDFLVMR